MCTQRENVRVSMFPRLNSEGMVSKDFSIACNTASRTTCSAFAFEIETNHLKMQIKHGFETWEALFIDDVSIHTEQSLRLFCWNENQHNENIMWYYAWNKQHATSEYISTIRICMKNKKLKKKLTESQMLLNNGRVLIHV